MSYIEKVTINAMETIRPSWSTSETFGWKCFDISHDKIQLCINIMTWLSIERSCNLTFSSCREGNFDEKSHTIICSWSTHFYQ